MSPEGALTLTLRVSRGRVDDVQVSSTRRTDYSAALAGRDVHDAALLVPSLFSICAAAHAVAGLGACEAALGVHVDEQQARLRRLLTQLEALDNHAFQVCVAWAKHAGAPPAVEALRRLRRATEALRLWAHDGTRWTRVGGVGFTPSGSPRALVDALREAVDALVPAAARAGDARELERWSHGSDSPVAALLRQVRALDAAHFGKATRPLLPAMSAAWYGQRLVGPDFGARPALDSGAAEAGALSRVAEHPALAPLVSAHGHTVLTRLLAVLVDLHALVGTVTAAAEVLEPSKGHAPAERDSGQGAGVADTSRGRLAHAVELTSNTVVHWRQVAPTEWSFHPFGVLREALLGAPAEDLARRAGLLVLSLDPCVPCRVVVED
ncbi:MAG: nickel-dependent hydrogenase large subunit [Myxococcales bacterium]|nr:nickel-dependent hydrogenase large subunit [Myxococcales bacterium]